MVVNRGGRWAGADPCKVGRVVSITTRSTKIYDRLHYRRFFIGQTLGFGITTMDRIKLSQHLSACESCRKLKQDAEEETKVK